MPEVVLALIGFATVVTLGIAFLTGTVTGAYHRSSQRARNVAFAIEKGIYAAYFAGKLIFWDSWRQKKSYGRYY